MNPFVQLIYANEKALYDLTPPHLTVWIFVFQIYMFYITFPLKYFSYFLLCFVLMFMITICVLPTTIAVWEYSEFGCILTFINEFYTFRNVCYVLILFSFSLKDSIISYKADLVVWTLSTFVCLRKLLCLHFWSISLLETLLLSSSFSPSILWRYNPLRIIIL
jgi:hypothetical protein